MTQGATPELRVVEIAAVATHPLRRAVLRNGDPDAVVEFPEDGWPGVVHFGAYSGDELIGVSTWIPRAEPAAGAGPGDSGRAVQLRGMATADGRRRAGIGGILVEAGCARSAADGVAVVWARARDAALPFYERHRFEIVGDGFVDATTALPHHFVRRQLGQV